MFSLGGKSREKTGDEHFEFWVQVGGMQQEKNPRRGGAIYMTTKPAYVSNQRQ